MTKVQNSAISENLFVVDPYSGIQYDILSLFKFLNDEHDTQDGLASFSTLVEKLLSAQRDMNLAASESEIFAQSVPLANCFLSDLAVALLQIRPRKTGSVDKQPTMLLQESNP